MSQSIQTYSISAPGFFGLNTQDSPLDLQSGFALVATNCVIDQYGRIGCRKGWTKVNSSTGTLGYNDIGVIHELIEADGTLTVLLVFGVSTFSFQSLTRRRIDRWGHQVDYHERKIIQHLQEGFGGAKDVKLLGREGEFLSQHE